MFVLSRVICHDTDRETVSHVNVWQGLSSSQKAGADYLPPLHGESWAASHKGATHESDFSYQT